MRDSTFGLTGRSKATAPNRATYTLADAALQVLGAARRERWPLLTLATLNGEEHTQHWFATNLLEIVSVQGRRIDATQNEPLTINLRRGLTLTDDMDGLVAAGEGKPRFVDLRVTHAEFKKYLTWARTVQ